MTSKSNPEAAPALSRTILPIPDQPYAGTILYDARNPDAKYAPIRPLRPPKGAPHVLVVLLDDIGFGASSAFGGPVHTPVAERLAAAASNTPASTPPRSARRPAPR
jgi:hypothetical protein